MSISPLDVPNPKRRDEGRNLTAFRNSLPPSAIMHVVLAALVLAWSGFFTMDFILSGIYTWPRCSRVVALTGAIIILTYEFIYKEHQTRYTAVTGVIPLKVVFYCCMIPYMVGSLALLALITFT